MSIAVPRAAKRIEKLLTIDACVISYQLKLASRGNRLFYG